MRKLTPAQTRAARDAFPGYDDEQIAELLDDLLPAFGGMDRARPERVIYTPKVPERWQRKSQVVLERYAVRKVAVLGAFGREHPFPVDQVDALLADLATASLAREHDYIDAIKYRAGAVRVLGYGHKDGPGHPTGFGVDEDAWKQEYATWRSEHPLSYLKIEARRMHTDCGIDVADAVAYLITDQQVTLPWLSIVEHPGAFGPRFSIEVGSVDVSAAEVRDAWSERRQAATNSASFHAPDADSLALVAFVDARIPEDAPLTPGGVPRIPYSSIWREWRQTPEVMQGARSGYKSWRSLKNMYETTKGKTSAKGGESR